MCSVRPGSIAPTHQSLLAPLAPGRSLLELAGAWDALAPRLPARSPEDTRIILEALKLAVSRAPPPAVADNSSATPPVAALAASAALGTAARLADLAAYDGLPLDAAAMCAGILADGAAAGRVSLADAAARVGPDAASLLGDVLRVRALPAGADVYDGATSAWLRDAALERVDRRAAMVEVAARAAGLAAATRERASGHTPPATTTPSTAALTSVDALEALQVYAPLGHALGMWRVAAEMEDAAFRVLFPRAYTETDAWLASVVGPAATTLAGARDALVEALASDEALADLAGGCEVRVRVKSLFSLMKKLLRLDDLDAGGRDRGALHDVLGMRVIVHPREADDEEVEGGGGGSDSAAAFAAAAAAADADAITACYAVRDTALRLWPRLPDRDKDYITAPKANGYASLHVTLVVGGDGDAGGSDAHRDADASRPHPGADTARPGSTVVELQIRTRAMHDAAEHGHAAHTAYKGGMTAEQTSALAAWSAHARALRSASSSTTTTSLPLDRTESAAALFHALDTDGDGTVSADELASALSDLGVDCGAAVAAAAALVAAAGSGGEALTLAEFQALMAKASVWEGV